MNCPLIYIGINFQVMEIENEIFSVELVSSTNDEYLAISAVLNTNYIYYLAPHTGCGCGWEVHDVETEFNDLCRKSLDALKTYLYGLSLSNSIYVFACNQNSIGAKPELEIKTHITYFMPLLDEFVTAYGSHKTVLAFITAADHDQ